jgi:hypothetical protein
MNKLLITLTLALLSTNAMATWTRVGRSDLLGGVTVYVDYDTIQRSGNKVKMWSLKDYKAAQETDGVKYSSFKIQEEFNCDDGQKRDLTHLVFSRNMGSGQVVNSDDNAGKWSSAKPGSIGERELKAACGK